MMALIWLGALAITLWWDHHRTEVAEARREVRTGWREPLITLWPLYLAGVIHHLTGGNI